MFPVRSVFIFFGIGIMLPYMEIYASPINGRDLDPELMSEKFEGDMILTDDQLNLLKNPPTKIQGRNGLIAESKRWPNKIVYYKFVGNFDLVHRQAILEGIASIEAQTCVRFKEADDFQRNYVAITSNSGGCFSNVGYLAKVQTMNLEVYPLNEGCFRAGSITHELMHVLGFYHQQSDPQRDDYVEILYNNIIPGKEFNFEKYKSTIVTDFDMGYDYESCMHYTTKAFSANGQDTIRPINPQAKIGQREGLSEKDITKINIMYKCPIMI